MVGFHDSLPRELAGFIASAFGPIHQLDVKPRCRRSAFRRRSNRWTEYLPENAEGL